MAYFNQGLKLQIAVETGFAFKKSWNNLSVMKFLSFLPIFLGPIYVVSILSARLNELQL